MSAGTPDDDTPKGNLRICVLRAPEDDASRDPGLLAGQEGCSTRSVLPPPAEHVGGDEPGTCKRGHPRTAENTYMRADGRRECVVCKREVKRARREGGHDHDSA